MNIKTSTPLDTFKNVYVYLQENNSYIANHIIVIIAFFLPTIESARTSSMFILITLLFFKKDLFEKLKEVLSNRVIQAFILFWLINLLLVPFSTDVARSYTYMNDIKFFVVYPIVLLLHLDKSFIPRIISAFILGMFISELLSYSLIFHLIEHVPLGTHHASASDPSPFLYHMGYGVILALTASILLYKSIFTSHIWHRVAYVLFFITVSINVFVNAGRTGYVIYAIAIMSMLLQIYRRHFFKILTVGLIFLAIVYSLAFHFSPLFQKRMGLAIQSTKNIVLNGNLNSNLGARVAMGEMAIEAIKDKPLIGYGPAIAAEPVSAKAREVNYKIKFVHHIPFYHIDNQYLETLVTIGFVGLLFLINIFFQIFTYKQEDQMLKKIQIVLLVLVVAYGFEATVITDMGFIPKLFFIFTTFTLVKAQNIPQLSRVTPVIFFYYAVATISILAISRVT